MKLNTLQALAFGVLCIATGCASSEPLEAHPLPYRVGILPMQQPVVGQISPGELPGEATELSLNLASPRVTAAIQEALQAYCFSDVQVLDCGELDPSMGAFERERLLLECAREAQVDLLVELDLHYDAEIYRENSGTFWMNYPLFLFLAPSNWFLSDNNYFADVQLTTTVYDLNAIEAGGFSIGDPAARVVTTNSRYVGTELDFVDRSEGFGSYALGILIPSGFIDRESEDVGELVHSDILDELTHQMVQGIQSRRSELVSADWIAPVFMDPSSVQVSREGDEVVVRGSVSLYREGLADRVHALRLSAGSTSVSVEPAASSSDGAAGFAVMPFQARVPAARDANYVHIECEAGSRDRYIRSYTFPIPAN